MKTKCLFAFYLLAVLALILLKPAPAQEKKEEKPKPEKFGALAYMPHGAGPAMVGAGARVNVDLYVKSYTSDEEAKVLASALLEGGADALLKKLEDAKSIGKITMTGRVGFYDLKLIRSHKTEQGRRIYAIGDRPVGFLEAYVNNRSRDYPFGILQLDLKKNSKGKEEGSGALLYSAKIKVLNNNTIDIESYGIGPIQLMGVRKL
ncbi:MAG TPA: hypothetical protein VFS76_10480 [Pyrinomonadaceae bacterium]|nr:hypothetical protein [Pyrinomonadaceae bacterium]